MLQPVRTRWRKAHKGRIHGTATRASSINYGAFALKLYNQKELLVNKLKLLE
jgi:large subunit ribosomal protein L16